MRIIDADFACKGCIRYRTSLPCEECVVKDAPTVDAVAVVFCRECKHLNVVNRKELYAHCPKTNTVFLPF